MADPQFLEKPDEYKQAVIDGIKDAMMDGIKNEFASTVNGLPEFIVDMLVGMTEEMLDQLEDYEKAQVSMPACKDQVERYVRYVKE